MYSFTITAKASTEAELSAYATGAVWRVGLSLSLSLSLYLPLLLLGLLSFIACNLLSHYNNTESPK